MRSGIKLIDYVIKTKYSYLNININDIFLYFDRTNLECTIDNISNYCNYVIKNNIDNKD